MDEEKEIPKIKTSIIEDLPDMDIGHMMLFKSNFIEEEGPIIYIKESYGNIHHIISLLPNLKIEIKDLIYRGGYAISLILMIRLNLSDNLIYGQWFNKYNEKDRELIKGIVFQDYLNFCIVDVDKRVRIRFRYRNIYIKCIWNHFKINESDIKWSQEMFESEIMSLNSIVSSKKDMFNIK